MRSSLVVAILALAFPRVAFSACPDVPQATFAKDLASAHAANALTALDKKYPDIGPFQIFIEHSVGEEENGSPLFVSSVPSFRALAELLQSRRSEGVPRPQSRSLRKCANGVCSYDFLDGIQHNTLYLKELRYNDYKRCLEVETIWFLDGD